jgi:hypothetical protein
MCSHIWIHKCKVPGNSSCPWCDICKLCDIKPINVIEERTDEKDIQ